MQWMGKTKVGTMVLFLALSCLGNENHTVRTWTDVRGGEIQARFVSEVFGSVTLLTEEGRRINIDVDQLSDQDVRYLRTRVLPELDISLTRTTASRQPSRYGMPGSLITAVDAEVTIRKTSRNPFEGELTAELFLVSREVGTTTYRLSGRTKESFYLTRANRDRHTFQYAVELFRFRDMNSGDERGQEHQGYVITVRDQEGRIAGWSTNLRFMTRERIPSLQRIRVGGWFNESLRQAPVPRPVYERPNRWIDG